MAQSHNGQPARFIEKLSSVKDFLEMWRQEQEAMRTERYIARAEREAVRAEKEAERELQRIKLAQEREDVWLRENEISGRLRKRLS